MNASFFDDFKIESYDEFISGQVDNMEFFIGIDDDELNKYRKDLPFGLEKIFIGLDDDRNLNRGENDIILLKEHEAKVISEYKPVEKNKVKIKNRHVSQK